MKYRQINSPYCEAAQWFPFAPQSHVDGSRFVGVPGPCEQCGQEMKLHGFISNDGRTEYVVHPGDYVLFTDHYYPIAADVFKANYTPLLSGDDRADIEQSKYELDRVLVNLRERSRGATNVKEERGAATYHIRIALHWLRDAVEILSVK